MNTNNYNITTNDCFSNNYNITTVDYDTFPKNFVYAFDNSMLTKDIKTTIIFNKLYATLNLNKTSQ